MPSSPHVDQLGILSEPRRFLKMEVIPPFSEMERRCHLEDEVRHAARAVNSEVGVVVVPGKDVTYVFLIDLQPDLLGDSQEKLVYLANRIFGFDDPADPTIEGSKRRKRGSSRLRRALVSGSGNKTELHTLAYGDVTFTGERNVGNTRTVLQDTDVASEHTIVGISRSPTFRLQLRTAAGRNHWASVKLNDVDLQTLNSVLDEHFHQIQVDITKIRDNSGGFEIKAADLVAALANAKCCST